jgi:plasmid maintenance system antidote protein VapI
MIGAPRVRSAIRASGLSQKEVAARLTISEQYLSDICNSRRAVSAFVAVRLQAVLGVDGRKLMLDQALVDWERAKIAYFKAGKND